MNVVIHGYTGPLQEGDNLTLTCERDSNPSLVWIFTANGKMPKLISQNRTINKHGTELSDAGEYTCSIDASDPLYIHSYARYDLSASVRVEVLKSVSDNHNIIIGGSAAGVIIIVIIVVLVIALVQTCRKQTRFASCKYTLIMLILHLKPVIVYHYYLL